MIAVPCSTHTRTMRRAPWCRLLGPLAAARRLVVSLGPSIPHRSSILESIVRAPTCTVPFGVRASSSSSTATGVSAPSCVRAHKNGQLVLHVFVKPGAKQSSITQLSEGSLHVRVSAAPIDGEANAALLSFLASTLRLRKSTLSVGRGSTGRTKSIVVDAAANDHLSAEELTRRVVEAANKASDED